MLKAPPLLSFVYYIYLFITSTLRFLSEKKKFSTIKLQYNVDISFSEQIKYSKLRLRQTEIRFCGTLKSNTRRSGYFSTFFN